MTEVGFKGMEAIINSGAWSAVGDPFYLALLVMGFLIGFAFLQGGKGEILALAAVPAFILALNYSPWLAIFVALLLGAGVVYRAIMKLVTM